MKYFTPKEASDTLPLVRNIVMDILETGKLLKSIVVTNIENPQNTESITMLQNRLEDFIQELTDLGCYFKDWNFEVGLVDFPAIINGREVMLCWKSDEDSLIYYHGLNDGFAGRQPIPEKYFY